MVGDEPGSLKKKKSLSNRGHWYWYNFPLLTVNYRETSSATISAGAADVNKPRRNGFIELGEVAWLLPSFCRAKKIKLTVREKILDEMTLVRKRADVKQTKVDSSVVMLD